MEEFRKFTKDVVFVGIAIFFLALQKIILLPILSKLLGAAEYGVWSQVIFIVELLAMLASLGLIYSLPRFLASLKSKKDVSRQFVTIMFVTAVMSLIFSIILFFLAKPIAYTIMKDMSFYHLIQVSSALIILTALNYLLSTLFRTFREMKKYATVNVFQSVGEISLIFYVVIKGYGLVGAIVAPIIVRTVVFFIQIVLVRNKIEITTPKLSSIKDHFVFGLPLIPTAVLLWFINSSDLYIISYFKSLSDVGVYSAVYTLSSVFVLYMTPISYVLYPAISKSWDLKKETETKTYLSYSLKYYALLAIPTLFGLLYLGKRILGLVTTQEFLVGSTLFFFIAVGLLLYKGTEVFIYALSMFKKTAIIGKVYSLAAVLNIALNLLFVPVYGVYGAAFSTLITYIFIQISMITASRKYIKFEVGIKTMIKSTIASISMVLILKYLITPLDLSIVFIIVLGAIFYSIVLVILGGISRGEAKLFFSLAKRAKNKKSNLSTDIDPSKSN